MTAEFDHRNLAILLLQARESVMSAWRPVLKQFSLTEQQWRVMRALHEHGASAMEAGEIARQCCILSPSLTGMLERMERDKLIRRARAAADQRKVVVSLTAQSKALVQRLSPLIDAQYRELERRLGARTLSTIYTLLDELVGALPRAQTAAPSGALTHRAAPGKRPRGKPRHAG